MKNRKIIAVALSCVFLFGTASCSFKKASDVTETEVTEETSESEPEYYEIGDLIETDNYSFVVNGIRNFNDSDYWYAVIDFTFTNNTEESVRIDNRSTIQGYLDNQRATEVRYPEFPWIVNENLLFDSANVNPGRSISGFIVYVVYRDWDRIEIQCYDSIVAADKDDTEYVELYPEEVVESLVPEATTAATTTEPSPTPTPAPEPEYESYIVDTETNTFHVPFCPALADVPSENQIIQNGNHDSMVNNGYVPCEECHS